MEPVLITIITFVAVNFIDQFISEEGYGRLKKFFFPSAAYKNRLIQLIYESIEEYEKVNPLQQITTSFHFTIHKYYLMI